MGEGGGDRPAAISDDGRYVTYEGDLVYRRDMVTGSRAVVSTAAQGVPGSGGGTRASADGRFVAFTSYATGLDGAATAMMVGTSVYLRDMQSGTPRLISRAAGTNHGADDQSELPLVSGDGRYVVFQSWATDLVAGIVSGGYQLYRYDRISDSVELVSADPTGGRAAGPADHPAMSADGRFVAFTSGATNLVPGAIDQPYIAPVFLRDMAVHTTTVVSHGMGSATAMSGDSPAVSADGSTVVFRAADTTGLTGMAKVRDPSGFESWDVFAFDRASGDVDLLSVAASGATDANGSSSGPAVSADGRTVAFLSGASDLVEGFTDANNLPPHVLSSLDYLSTDVFVRHRDTATTELVSRSASGTATGDHGSTNVSIAAGGDLVVFESDASDLVPGLLDRNNAQPQGTLGMRDVFAYRLSRAEMRAVSVDDEQPSATLPGTAYEPMATPDGHYVAFSLRQPAAFPSDFGYTFEAARRAMEPPLPAPPPPAWPTPPPDVVIGPTPTMPTTTTRPVVNPPEHHSPPPRADTRSGYWMVGQKGTVYAFGAARWMGDAPVGDQDAVDIEATPTFNGYWVVDGAGHVFSFGDASYHGNATGLSGGERVTSLSRTGTGQGYWLYTDRGRALPRGDAATYGDMSGTSLNGPVLDSVPTARGGGYYMVASDGGVFSFGDARFYGSMGSERLNAPVRSLVPDRDGSGYWLVATDGGVFSFDAPFRGSMGGQRLNQPVTGMVRFGDGYLMVARDGGIFDFSSRPFDGSLGANPPAIPIVSVAALDAGAP